MDFSSMVFSNLISEFSCKTIRGCGKKVSTRLSYLLFAVLSIIFREFFDALWTPSKVPNVRIVFFVVLKSLIE
jgi:hypothetical protein